LEHTFKSYVCAGLSLVGVPGLLKIAQKSDFTWLLRKQEGLSSLPPEELSKKELESYVLTASRQSALRSKTLISLAWIVSAITIGWFSMFYCFSPSSITTRQLVSIASVALFAWATLGRLGWTEQSIKRTTIYERLDIFMFWFLYWIGTLCAVAALAND